MVIGYGALTVPHLQYVIHLLEKHSDTISIEAHMNTMKVLHENGIHTVLFMSPIFLEITDYKEIIEKSRLFVYEYWFENLNLRGEYKVKILKYVNEKYPQFMNLYKQIYVDGDKDYWDKLATEVEEYCEEHSIIHTNFFYHEKLVAQKKGNILKLGKYPRFFCKNKLT